MPKRISEMTAASTTTGAELVPVVQSGANRRTTMAAFVNEAPSFAQSGTGNAPRSAQAKMREIVSITDYYADGVGTNTTRVTGDAATINTLGIRAAFNSMAANGGEVFVPPGDFWIDGLLTQPNNTTFRGTGWRASKITQRGAAYAIAGTTGCKIADMAVWLGSSATGGINFTNMGWGTVSNVDIEGDVGNTTGIGARLDETYRIQFDYVYIRNLNTGLKFVNNVTTFEYKKGNIGVCSAKAVDADIGSTKILETYFEKVYFESNRGTNPFKFSGTGRAVFNGCGFEDNCTNDGYTGTIANPQMIVCNNPSSLVLQDCQFSGWPINVQTYSGTLYFVYMGDNAPSCRITGGDYVQNVSVGSNVVYFVRQAGVGSEILSIESVTYGGNGFASQVAVETSFFGGLDATTGTKNFHVGSCRLKWNGGSYRYNSSPPSDVITAVVTSSGLSSTLWTRTYGKRSFTPGRFLHIVAWGRRTGTANTKQVFLDLNAGGLNAFAATTSVTAAEAWRTDIYVLFHAYNSARISVAAYDNAAAVITNSSSAAFTRDTAANDLIVTLRAECADAGDAITLDGFFIDRR